MKKLVKKATNYVKSIPTRLKAKAEYKQNMYTVVGTGMVKRKKPLRTYNKASTGIRKKAK